MNVAILFKPRPVKGAIIVRDGTILALNANDSGHTSGHDFDLPCGGRLTVALGDLQVAYGSRPTLLQIVSTAAPCTFFVRDVTAISPLWVPEYGVAMVPAEDNRTYAEVVAAIQGLSLRSDFDRFAEEPEESYQHAATLNRKQISPIWLGVARDPRYFRVNYLEQHGYWGEIQSAVHSYHRPLPGVPGFGKQPGAIPGGTFYRFVIGQGAACRFDITRGLEDNALPILNALQREQDVDYHLTIFATPETTPLAAGQEVTGFDWEQCFACTSSNMLEPTRGAQMRADLEAAALASGSELLCCVRINAVNTAKVPRYAWFRSIRLSYERAADDPATKEVFAAGVATIEPLGVAIAAHMINGEPMRESEMAILLPPGGSVTYDIIIPHAPIPQTRATALLGLDVAAHLTGCRQYWRARLASATAIHLPEEPIDNAVHAGLLHCDLTTLGRGSGGPLVPSIGWYGPIGTESSPIIQYFDSVGWHDVARRCIQFFFERQLDSGMIQNFANYQSETGALLWSAGEHFRYTHDLEWVRQIAPNLKRAADFLLQWRARNLTAEARAAGGYGMIAGKVADTEDYYHSFFLNATTYLGLKRVAEMLTEVDPPYAAHLQQILPEYRQNIRDAINQAQALAPLAPMGDGSWAPLVAAWAEYRGANIFFADGGKWFTHGAFASRSSLVGAIWLIICEVLEPREMAAEFLIKTNAYPVTVDNAALSQPYYCRHDFAHLLRGETKAYLKTYYNQITGLHDQETYTCWEHYYHAGQHKTHEEAWFLMQTRWMLWLERHDELHLLSAIPRHWLAPGKQITLHRAHSYFGTLSLEIKSCDTDGSRFEATVTLTPGHRRPKAILLRLPHPEQLKAKEWQGGNYLPDTESFALDPTQEQWRVTAQF